MDARAGLWPFYLYLPEIFSRKIVGCPVHERESADLAAALIRQGRAIAEGCIAAPAGPSMMINAAVVRGRR